MKFLKTTDDTTDSPLDGQISPLDALLNGVRDATRRANDALTQTARRWSSQSLVRYRDRRISVGIDVGQLGLDRLEPQDVGA
ncbi:MAG: hypothetical protein CMN30_13885 [Sandaracinus sp.]|nr:hypothetical protein [Sandaracinus sp.]